MNTKKIDDHRNSTGITFDHNPTYIPDLNKETLSKPQIEGSFFKPQRYLYKTYSCHQT